MKKDITIVIVLMILHSLEEVASYFFSSHPVGLPSLGVYVAGQVALFVLLAFAFWKYKLKLPQIAVGLILLYELVHIFTAWKTESYTPGLITAIPLLVFAFLYWRKLFINLNLKKI